MKLVGNIVHNENDHMAFGLVSFKYMKSVKNYSQELSLKSKFVKICSFKTHKTQTL